MLTEESQEVNIILLSETLRNHGFKLGKVKEKGVNQIKIF